MKVLLINGSPHVHGSTHTVLSEIANTLAAEGIEADIYDIGDQPTAPCRGCQACAKLGKCIIQSDKVNEFLDMAAAYDGFIIGSPVHYASASGVIVPFMDRVFYANSLGKRNIFRLKPGAALVVARRAGTTATLDQLNKYFQINEMPIISGRYWNMVFGSSAQEVLQDAEGMQNMRILAKNMAYHLKCRAAAQQAGIPEPEKESITPTNFIR